MVRHVSAAGFAKAGLNWDQDDVSLCKTLISNRV
jgi:hypothetical protein